MNLLEEQQRVKADTLTFFEDFLQKSCKSAKNFVSLWSLLTNKKYENNHH